MANIPSTLTLPVDGTIQYGGSFNVRLTFPGSQTSIDWAFELRRVSDDVLLWTASGQIGTSATSITVGYSGPSLVTGVQYKVRGMASSPIGSGGGVFTPFNTFTFSASSPVLAQGQPLGDIGTTTPTINFTFSSPVPDNLASYQIQVRRVSDAVQFWDSGTVVAGGGEASTGIVSAAYGGTTLVVGTAYEWRVRATKASGFLTSYSAWRTFTPLLGPNPPTIVAPMANQIFDTLTPTFSGTYNQASGSDEDAWQYRIRQNNVLIYQSGDISTAIATGQAYGTANAGSTPSTAPALQWGTTYTIDMRSKDDNAQYSGWTSQRTFSTNAAPTSPTNLSPNGSVTGNTTPTLSWQHNDPNGDAQTAARIWLWETASTTPVSGYDPKELSQAGQTHTVTETLTDSPATGYSWEVATLGTAGPGYGPKSAIATFTVSEVPTIAITAPTPSEVLSLPSYLVEWDFTGGTQQDYRLVVYAADNDTIVYDSGIVASAAESATIPPGFLQNGNTYFVQVIARDTFSVQGESDRVEVTTSWTVPPTLTGFTVTGVQ